MENSKPRDGTKQMKSGSKSNRETHEKKKLKKKESRNDSNNKNKKELINKENKWMKIQKFFTENKSATDTDNASELIVFLF